MAVPSAPLPIIGRPAHSLVTTAVMISGRLTVTFEPLPALRAYATTAAMTSVIARFGGAAGESAARIDDEDVAANGLAVRAPAAWGTETEPVAVASAGVRLPAAAGAVSEVVLVMLEWLAAAAGLALVAPVDSVSLVGVVELGRPVVPSLVLFVVCFDEGRPVLPILGPVLLWLEVEESPPEESAWATPAELASEAQTPTVRAPVPSQMAALLWVCCARWRAAVR